MTRKQCNVCGLYQNEFLHKSDRSYCNGCKSIINVNNNNEYGRGGYNSQWDERENSNEGLGSQWGVLTQDSVTLSAHDKILVFNNLRYLLEGLEEFIEKAGYYPDFKRQLRNITLPKENSLSVDDAEDFFLTNLILYVSMVNRTPEYVRKGELMDEYYKWIDATGIDINNCPEKLRQFLVEIKNVLEGNSERIVKQTEEYLKDKKTNPQDTLDLFGAIQKPLNENREKEKLYKGKTDKDVEIQNKFNANVDQGKKTFDQISRSSSSHGDYHFYSKKDKFFGSGNPQLLSSFKIVQNVKDNPKNWRIDEIITEYNNHGDTKEEKVLIHASAQQNDYEGGGLRFDRQPIYRSERFNKEEIKEIERALNISQSSSSPASSSANQVIRQGVVNDIKFRQGGFRLYDITFGGNIPDEKWLIHSSVDTTRGVVFDSKNMYKIKDLNELEQKEIRYKKSEASLKLISHGSASEIQKDNKGGGVGGILAIISAISVIVIAGIVVGRKKLNKKIKK